MTEGASLNVTATTQECVCHSPAQGGGTKGTIIGGQTIKRNAMRHHFHICPEMSLTIAFSIALASRPCSSQTNFWQPVSGPDGGLISVTCFHDSLIFIGGHRGVYVSADNGLQWQYCGLGDAVVTTIIETHGFLFAGTSKGVFRSCDLGATWQIVNGGLQYQYVPVADLVAKDSVLFFCNEYDGVFKSTSFGQTWIQSNAGIDNGEIIKLLVGENSILASARGGAGSGMYRSTNDGVTWIRLDPDPYAWNAEAKCKWGRTTHGADFEVPTRMLASTDYGLTWQATANPIPHGTIGSLYADHTGLYAGMYRFGIYKSFDGGASWTSSSSEFLNLDISTIGGNDRTIVAGTPAGVHVTVDGGSTWAVRNTGLGISMVSTLSTFQNFILAGTYGAGILRSSDGGTTWEQIGASLNAPYIIDILSYRNLVFALASVWTNGYQARVCVGDGSSHWFPWTTTGMDAYELHGLSSNDRYLYLASSNGMFRSGNQGSLWELMRNGVENNGRPNVSQMATIDSVVIAVNGGSTLMRSTDYGDSWSTRTISTTGLPPVTCVAATSRGFYLGTAQVPYILKSTNLGLTWQQQQTPLLDAYVTKIAGSADTVLAALAPNSTVYGSGGTLLTTNGGTTWRYFALGVPNQEVRSLISASGRWYAGTWGKGIYRLIDSTELPRQLIPLTPASGTIGVSLDPLLTWSSSSQATSCRLQVARNIEFTDRVLDRTVAFVSSQRIGPLERFTSYFWRVASINQFGIAPYSSSSVFTTGMPEEIRLEQNFPNPFNTGTTVPFAISRRTHVRLIVFDLLGREVTRLVDGMENPGQKRVRFETSALASGVYFYRIQADNLTVTKKLLLLR